MIQLTDFQYKVLTAMADLDISVQTKSMDQFDSLYPLSGDSTTNMNLLDSDYEGVFHITEQGRAMFKDAGLRRIQ